MCNEDNLLIIIDDFRREYLYDGVTWITMPHTGSYRYPMAGNLFHSYRAESAETIFEGQVIRTIIGGKVIVSTGDGSVLMNSSDGLSIYNPLTDEKTNVGIHDDDRGILDVSWFGTVKLFPV